MDDAAAWFEFQLTAARRRLALSNRDSYCLSVSFNSQPPEGGWGFDLVRLKSYIRFNSQPPEGGWTICLVLEAPFKCFNSQPPEGGWPGRFPSRRTSVCFNSQPPEGGWLAAAQAGDLARQFQLTAARRRLV